MIGNKQRREKYKSYNEAASNFDKVAKLNDTDLRTQSSQSLIMLKLSLLFHKTEC
jgi:hypothetical protein